MANPAPKLAPFCPIGFWWWWLGELRRPVAGINQAVRDIHKREKAEAAGIQFQFWVADHDSTPNTSPSENKQKMI